MKDSVVNKLLNDFFENDEYENWARIILNKNLDNNETDDDVIELQEEIRKLSIQTSSEQWKSEKFETYMTRIKLMQERESLGEDDLIEVFAILRLFPNLDFHLDLELMRSKWIIETLRKKGYNNIFSLHEILTEYRASQLEKVFSNVRKNRDQSSAETFFYTLKKANLKHSDKSDILNCLAETWKDFNLGNASVFNRILEQLILKQAFSDGVNARMIHIYHRLKIIGWTDEDSYDTIHFALTKCSTELGATKICDGFDVAIDFAIDSITLKNVLEQQVTHFDGGGIDQLEFQHLIHEKALLIFKEPREKKIDELISDMEELYSYDDSQKMKNLKQEWMNVHKILLSSSKNIKNYRQDDILNWRKELSEGSNPCRFERIAVVTRAFELFSRYYVRDVQMLTLLILYKPEAGTLTQINTGEGKTAVVAMLAVLFALEEKKVDIVTSSKELAEPQSKYLEAFYEMFDLSSSHNYVLDKKKAYRSDILYGAIDDFEADVLRDEYNKSGTRSQRPFDIVIVDEVDSMLIDGKNSMVRLSSPIPGMNHLEPLLAAILIHVGLVASKIHEESGSLFYVDGDFSQLLDPEKTKAQLIQEHVEEHMGLLLRDPNRITENNKHLVEHYPKMMVPTHFRELVLNNRLQKWIQKAIYARYQCNQNVDYVLKDKKIKIVDVENTGVVHENMTWSEGLTQFLQMIHGARIESEQLTTKYIAHPTYFKRYKKNIYGLSGTLGGTEEKEFLRKTYDVELLGVPPFKVRQHIQLTPSVLSSENQWKKEVIHSLMRKVDNGRACLVICNSIKKVEELSRMLNIDFNYPKERIKLYRTQEDSSVVREKIGRGIIIFSTNIAGRGTDIRLTDEVNKHGGLHVCLTFLPENMRVEYQNTGRTSRTGNLGTSQFVLFDSKKQSVEDMKRYRDVMNATAFRNASKEVKNVLLRAKVFQKFCHLLDSQNGEQIHGDCPDHIVRSAIEERFGIWLKMNEDCIEDENEYLNKFSEFEDVIREDKLNGTSVKNPYYYVKSARIYILAKQYELAINECTKAIFLDKNYAENAYYNRGFARLAMKSYNSAFIDDAIEDFEKARDLIKIRENELHIVQQACSTEGSTEATQQLARKLNLYSAQKSSINLAIGHDVKDLEKELVNFQKYKMSMEDALNNFVSLEKLQEDLEHVCKEREEDDKVMELESKILSFKTKEEIKEDMKSIVNSIKDLEKLKEFKGVLFDSKSKVSDVKVNLMGIEETFEENHDSYKNELQEYQENGYIGRFSISEVNPIDWWSVLGVMAIGVGQILCGGAIAVFTVGSGLSVGLGVLMEGISDVIASIRDGIINRNFSWKNWGIQKAISYTVSIVCAGMSALKNAFKTAYVAIKGVLSPTTTILTQTVKEGWTLVAKKIGLDISKGVAKEFATILINLGLNSTTILKIEEGIAQIVQPIIEKELLNDKNIQKLLQIDYLNKNTHYQSIILEKAMKTLHSNTQQNELLTIGTGIIKGIISSQKGFGEIITLYNTVEAFQEIVSYVPILMRALKADVEIELRKAEVIERKKDSSRDKSGSSLGNNLDQRNEGEHQITSEKNTDDQDNDIDTSKKKFEQIEASYEKLDISKKISISATKHISNVIKGKLIQPAVQYASNVAVGSLFSYCDASIQKQISSYQAGRRVEVFANKDRDGLLDDSYKKNYQNPKNMAKAKKLIGEVKSGSELGIAHIGSLSDITGYTIHVLDGNGRVATVIGDESSGRKVIQVEYHMDGQNGHWTLAGNVDAPGSGKNNCLLDVIAFHTGQNPKEMRINLANHMEANIIALANVAPDIDALEKDPARLFQGGACFSGDIAKIYSSSQGNCSNNWKAPGHPEGHIPNGTKKPKKGKDCVENYSMTGKKSALESKDVTHKVMKALLETDKAKMAYEKLNNGEDDAKLTFEKPEIEDALKSVFPLGPPTVDIYQSGKKISGDLPMKSFFVYLRHQHGQKGNKDADVFIQTAYPIAN